MFLIPVLYSSEITRDFNIISVYPRTNGDLAHILI